MGTARHCMLAELAALMNTCARVSLAPSEIQFQGENEATLKKVFTLLEKTFNIEMEVSFRHGRGFQQDGKAGRFIAYTGSIRVPAQVYTVLKGLKLLHRTPEGWTFERKASPLLTANSCCKRAYIRGAFLGGGSITNPEKTYHIEFINETIEHAKALQEMMRFFELDSRIIERQRQSQKSVYVLYLKDGTQIVDLLNVMEAHVALMDLENIRIVKEMRNNVNRQVNCETANLGKTVDAAMRQLEDIRYVITRKGLGYLPKGLEEIAILRLENEDASLKELGMMLDPPVGKSGVNHRLRKISQIADELRRGSEG